MPETEKPKKIPPQAVRRQFLIILPVLLNEFMVGCINGWAPNAIYFFKKGDPMSFSASECSLIASSCEISRMIFSMPLGCVVNKIGRKTMMLIAALVDLIAWLILSYYTSYIPIIIARFILGTGSALVSTVSLIAIAEISSPEYRAKITSINQVFFNFGQIFPSILTILFSSYHIVSYIMTIVATICFSTLFWSIETPHFLVSISKWSQAKENLKILRIGYSENDINEEFENFKNYIEGEKTRQNELKLTQFCTSKAILKPLLATVIAYYFAQSDGCLVIMTYITNIVPKIDFLPIIYYPFILQFIRISSSLITPFFIELFPRRITFLVAIVFTFSNCLLLGITYFAFVELSIKLCQWVVLFCVLLGMGTASTFIHSMTHTMRGELLPQAIKGTGGSICIMAQSASNVICFQEYYFITRKYDLFWIFPIFALNQIFFFFVIYFLLPETRGQYLADIQTKRGNVANDGNESVEIE